MLTALLAAALLSLPWGKTLAVQVALDQAGLSCNTIDGVWGPRSQRALDAFLAQATSVPAVIFLILWVVGMVAMGVLGSRLDLNEPRSNWIEEFLNTAAQVCLLIFALLVV
jgi:hypothetical protein